MRLTQACLKLYNTYSSSFADHKKLPLTVLVISAILSETGVGLLIALAVVVCCSKWTGFSCIISFKWGYMIVFAHWIKTYRGPPHVIIVYICVVAYVLLRVNWWWDTRLCSFEYGKYFWMAIASSQAVQVLAWPCFCWLNVHIWTSNTHKVVHIRN